VNAQKLAKVNAKKRAKVENAQKKCLLKKT
jgi:hypothetical protein